MRRSEFEITGFDDIVDVLRRCQVGHLGLVDADGPYVVPLNYAVEVVDGRVVIWCHGACEGRKIDVIRADPRVCFEAAILHEVVTEVRLTEITSAFESVIGFGRVTVVTDPVEARHGLALLVDSVAPGRSAEFPDDVPWKVAVLRIDLDHITGKHHPSPLASPA